MFRKINIYDTHIYAGGCEYIYIYIYSILDQFEKLKVNYLKTKWYFNVEKTQKR